MTLLIQTDGHINARRRRRNKARREQLDTALSTALDTAIEKVQAPRQEIQTGVNVGGVLSVGPGPRPSTLTVAANPFSAAQQNELRIEFQREAQRAVLGLAEELADDGLKEDSPLEKLRKLVPAEYLVAWAMLTAAVSMLDPHRLRINLRWAAWGVYCFGAFLYVLYKLHEAKQAETSKDCADGEGTGGHVDQEGESSESPEALRQVDVDRGAHESSVVSTEQLQPPDRRRSTSTTSAPCRQPPEGGNASSSGIARTPAGEINSTQAGGSSISATPIGEARHGAPSRSGTANPSLQVGQPAARAPTLMQLLVQAALSMVAFALFSVATSDFYMQPQLVAWAVNVIAPLFALFAQAFLPNGVLQ